MQRKLFRPSRRPARTAAFALGAVACAAANVAAAAPVTDPRFPGVTCDTVQMAARDGVKMTTFVYLPTTPGRYPTLLTRDPYGRLSANGCFAGGTASYAAWAQGGYAAVYQEVRGTYTSEGAFDPNVQEANDGYDAVEWAAAQPWSNGRVGMNGGSYLGLTQWQPTIHRPPHLVAIAPAITTSDLHDSWLYDNGVFLPWGSIYWIGLTFMADQMIRQGQAAGIPQQQIDAQVADFNARMRSDLLTKWVWDLPYTEFPEFKQYAPFFYDWVANPNYLGYWSKMDVETRYRKVDIPTLNSGAWYDPFQVGTVRNYIGMRTQGGSAEARNGARLVMAAYGHSGDSKTPTFGSDAFDAGYQRRFFDHYLKGDSNGFENEPPVNLYILVPPDTGMTGSGFWISASQYPLPGTTARRMYLSSHGDANTRLGGGALVADAGAVATTADRFTYDPHDPVPTTGGNYLNGGAALLKAGAADQSTVEMRGDVLVYTSAPLQEDLPVVGMVKIDFWAATSAHDTDFTAKLVDVHVDGFPHNVLDRVVRARFREGSKKPPKLVDPNTPYEYQLEIGNLGMIFPKGHRVRLEISSSNFPRVARNLNTAAPNQYATSRMVSAQQTIFHDASMPSFLELPVAAGVKRPAP